PIVDDPAESRIVPGAVERLRRVSTHLGLVAVLSSRPRAFLCEQIPVAGVLHLGSSGMEGPDGIDPSVTEWLPPVATATATLTAMFDGDKGIEVEAKSVSVAVHWRRAADPETARASVTAAVHRLATDTGLRVQSGKFVLELLPPVDIDKGST